MDKNPRRAFMPRDRNPASTRRPLTSPHHSLGIPPRHPTSPGKIPRTVRRRTTRSPCTQQPCHLVPAHNANQAHLTQRPRPSMPTKPRRRCCPGTRTVGVDHTVRPAQDPRTQGRGHQAQGHGHSALGPSPRSPAQSTHEGPERRSPACRSPRTAGPQQPNPARWPS